MLNYLIIEDLLAWMSFMDTTNDTKTISEKPLQKGDAEKKSNYKLDFDSAHFVRAFLKSLPRDLREMFTPKTAEDLATLEMRLIGFSKKEKDREQVRHLQKQFNLTLSPNMSLERTAIFARIKLLKKKRQS